MTDVPGVPRYVPTPGFEEMLERSPWIGQELLKKAALAAESAQQLAQAEAYGEGDYAEGIIADPGRVTIDQGRITAFVDARDFKSHWIEWGSLHNTAKHILQRGVERALGIMFSTGGGGWP